MTIEPTHSKALEVHIDRVHRLADEVVADMRREHEDRLLSLQDGHERRLREHYLPYKETYFQDVLERFANSAMAGCGLSYELFVQRFSEDVDRYSSRLSDDVAAAFINHASSQFDYATEAERYPGDDDDCCSHWFEYGYCPLGCERVGPEEDL